ncbi:MAG: type II CAAX endopeptidase family protein [Anaerolineaceae bacterium]|nr:type II CAAX endopeptidase family protein [Anaerolineaceae bacterium]
MNQSLSLRSANLLYLVTVLLILSAGAFIQSVSFGWGLLATEVLFILAPSLYVLRRARLPLSQGLRLNRISVGVAFAALLSGVGAWLVDAFLATLMMQISGYEVTSGAAMLPANGFQAVVIALGFCLAAPVCEEILFRGAILGAYQRIRPAKAAIMITSLMFAFYHMQLQGLVALLPIAFALGYIAWRTNSIYASMVAHFANNAMATFMLIMYAFHASITLPFPSLPAFGIGIVMLAAGIVLINRLAVRPPGLAPDLAVDTPRETRIARYWPLLAAAMLYVVVGGIEVVTFAMPELAAKPNLALSEPAGWNQPANFTFDILNKANQPVGEMNCRRDPSGVSIVLECQSHIEPYQVKVNSGTWMSDGAKVTLTAYWSRPGLRLVAMNGKMSFDSGGWYSWTVSPKGESLSMSVTDGDNKAVEQALPPDVLLNDEWPLRLMAASLNTAQANRVELGWQNTYRPESKDSGPVVKSSVLVVRGAEKIGQQTAWKVTLDQFTLWYAVDAPHRLLKFDSGYEIYVLK